MFFTPRISFSLESTVDTVTSPGIFIVQLGLTKGVAEKIFAFFSTMYFSTVRANCSLLSSERLGNPKRYT